MSENKQSKCTQCKGLEESEKEIKRIKSLLALSNSTLELNSKTIDIMKALKERSDRSIKAALALDKVIHDYPHSPHIWSEEIQIMHDELDQVRGSYETPSQTHSYGVIEPEGLVHYDDFFYEGLDAIHEAVEKLLKILIMPITIPIKFVGWIRIIGRNKK